MLVVGELINASRKAVKTHIDNGDGEAIAEIARKQREAGADFIDVNAGVFVSQEPEHLEWLVRTVQKAVDGPCCLDSPNPAAIEAALVAHRGKPIINSISLEKDRYERLLPVVRGSDSKVIALCMSDEGMPETRDDRLSIASKLIDRLTGAGISADDIYVDPLVQPVSTRDDFGKSFLDAVEGIRREFPGVHTICGLSNISYGLPKRKILNQVFLVMAMARGLDAAIINPLDRRMMAHILAAEALSGRDEYCGEWLSAYRQERLP